MIDDLKSSLGFVADKTTTTDPDESRLIDFVNLKLAARGFPICGEEQDFPYLKLGRSLILNYQEKCRLLQDHLCPADQRVQDFLTDYLGDLARPEEIFLPADALVVERHGLARMLSLPPDSDSFESDIISSYRVKQGVLHNPAKDRRTTKGVFHVVEGGLPIPADKKTVPKVVFANLLRAALTPPPEMLEIPFTSNQKDKARLFVSLLLRPVVVPSVPGFTEEKSMEIRFFAPGNLVSNLDFVESIFGNAGDPTLPENDASLDVDHWTGQTGCVILAPHLIHLKKKDLGLPHYDDASELQRRDSMCWKDPDEAYNDGSAFKLTCRDERGVVVTLIADNYYGYCKKEVKTQISYSANLFGLAEEEHAGGAIAFPTYDLGEDFNLSEYYKVVDHAFEENLEPYGSIMDLQPEGHGIDKTYPDIVYLPEDVRINLQNQQITWKKDGNLQTLRLLPSRTYVLPSGYKVEMIKPAEGRRWRLTGTTAEGTFCHKPCTVSGGGKSEISKSIADAMITGPVIISDFRKDFDLVESIIKREYGMRFRDSARNRPKGRPLLSPERSLGSVVKLLTPSPEYTDEYNTWLRTIPRTIRDLVFVVKRLYKDHWEANWRQRFSVDIINGFPGNELKYREQKLLTQYLRVGYTEDGSWRTFSLRKDFCPASKIQTEDDISASIVVPANQVEGLNPDLERVSWKFVTNCEYRLFQRPDEAINRGYDKQTEADFGRTGNFFSNYQPIDRKTAAELLDDAIRFDQFTKPMQAVFTDFVHQSEPAYMVSSAHPRIVNGSPSKNPRYLQNRLDLENPRANYLAEIGVRFYRRIPAGRPAPLPVNAVLPGRRNNPPDAEAGIRALAVFGPIHYQELPELFMDFIASLTGKSPSTTGAGSEGALTKGPFNALPPIIDLNNALVSFLVTGYDAFTTAAGWVGPKYRVDHDISLLVPEVWSRMFPPEREPDTLIAEGHLEAVKDFEYEGRKVLASRLGYRITESFVRAYFGRVFSNPGTVFTPDMLRPELQDLACFVDGVNNIVETQQRVAKLYFEDGSVEMACPPLKALLHIMAHGDYKGRDISDPEIRALFSKQSIVESDWYQARLDSKQAFDKALHGRQVARLETFLRDHLHVAEVERLRVADRLQQARDRLAQVSQSDYRQSLVGTIGRDHAIPVA